VRRTATKAVKVQPGDQIVVRAALPPNSGLARLYVWMKESGSSQFSPYVFDPNALALNGRPTMLPTLSMRLVPQRPAHTISFMADSEGQVVIVQEVDTYDDKLADVVLDLYMGNRSRLGRLKRRLIEWPKTVTL